MKSRKDGNSEEAFEPIKDRWSILNMPQLITQRVGIAKECKQYLTT